MERDFIISAQGASILDFNSHAHVERDLAGSYGEIFDFYFNSHAHVERDSSCVFVTIHIVISTHTLTWSVTHDAMCYNRITVISTHTLTWSVTLDVVYIWCLLNVMRTYFFI